MTQAFDENALRAALGRAAASVGATAVVGSEDDLALRVDHRIAVHERRAVRRRRAVVGALAAFVVVVGIIAYRIGTDSATERIEPVHPRSSRWSPMGPAPIGARYDHVQIWTGEEVLVFGGGVDGPDPDVAAYDPDTDSWRELAGADGFAGTALAVWTGTELLALGREGTLRGYDVEADRWRDLAPIPPGTAGSAPFARQVTAAVWTGSELLIANPTPAQSTSGSGIQDPVDPGGSAAYDPVTDTWRSLPVPPVLFEGSDAVWTGAQLVVRGLDGATPEHPSSRPVVAALDLATETWEVLPEPPLENLDNRSGVLLGWTGREVIVGGGFTLTSSGAVDGRDYAAYDLRTSSWRALPDAPVSTVGQQSEPEIWTGSELLVWQTEDGFAGPGGRPVLLDPVAGTWRLGPPSPEGGRQHAPATWTGSEVVWWSGDPTATDGNLAECCEPDATGFTFTP